MRALHIVRSDGRLSSSAFYIRPSEMSNPVQSNLNMQSLMTQRSSLINSDRTGPCILRLTVLIASKYVCKSFLSKAFRRPSGLAVKHCLIV